MDGSLTFLDIFGSALVYLPAIWIVIGLAILLIGVAPKVTGLVWFYVIFCFIVVYLGGILDFPEWLKNVSAFDRIPQIPAENMNVMSMVALVLIFVMMMIIGFIGYNKRDISG